VSAIVIPWGFRRAGGWDHYRVAQPVGEAHETLCQHRLRSDADKCLARRNNGGTGCINDVPVDVTIQGMLADLSRLTTVALRQGRELDALRVTAELIHAVAGGLVAATAAGARS